MNMLHPYTNCQAGRHCDCAASVDRILLRPWKTLSSRTFSTRSLRTAADQAYATVGVGSAQAKFLRHIGRESHISQADLARATQTAPTLTGRALESLVERGWVRRKRSEEDRRQYVLELTAAGQRARARVEGVRQGVLRRITDALDQKDIDDFDRVSKKIRDAVENPLESGRDSG